MINPYLCLCFSQGEKSPVDDNQANDKVIVDGLVNPTFDSTKL